MGAPVIHFEIGCRDTEKTAAFYRELFGWSTEQHGPATMISTGSEMGIGGHISSLGHEPHHYIVFYAMVDHLDATLKKAESLGGKTLIPPTEVPQMGHFAWFSDLDGNTIGIWKPLQQA